MARQHSPASLRTGKDKTKRELEEQAALERSLMGSSDLVYNVPEHLDELAKVYYSFIVEELKEADVLANIDIPIVEQTADCLSKLRACDKEIEANGLFVTEMDRYGHKKRVENVAVKTKLNLMTKYGQFANMLGLSPSARASLSAKKIEAKDNSNDPLLQLFKEFSE